MTDRLVFRLRDIRQAIDDTFDLMKGKTITALQHDRISRAAFERFMEIVSEASRHIPSDSKEKHGHIPWKQIADFGNHLRHAYHRIDVQILWDTYLNDLLPLSEVVDQILAASEHGSGD